MSESQNIEERVVTYYNDLIKNNVISGKAPVTLDWMKRQRILEGRAELDIRFGHVVIDNILGKKTHLANAEYMLNEAYSNGKLEFKKNITLSAIALELYFECSFTLDLKNPVRQKYSHLDRGITIPVFENTLFTFNGSRYHKDIFHCSSSEKFVSFIELSHIDINIDFINSPYRSLFLMYIQYACYYSLRSAFFEIKSAVEDLTK